MAVKLTTANGWKINQSNSIEVDRQNVFPLLSLLAVCDGLNVLGIILMQQ